MVNGTKLRNKIVVVGITRKEPRQGKRVDDNAWMYHLDLHGLTEEQKEEVRAQVADYYSMDMDDVPYDGIIQMVAHEKRDFRPRELDIDSWLSSK
ncbi:MAG: hypothetical protein D6746_08570 [Bacteroidetes bacterium]|nr:MAG: hypothetical protein D6746_08570 [Bacteroidota bacterium]